MASAVDSRLAYARLSAVATASRLPTAIRGSNNSYTTSWDTTETAIIEFADPGISVSRVRIGPTLATMTDDEILDLFNAMLAAQAEIAAEFDSTAVDHVSRGQRPVGAARSGSLQLYRG